MAFNGLISVVLRPILKFPAVETRPIDDATKTQIFLTQRTKKKLKLLAAAYQTAPNCSTLHSHSFKSMLQPFF